MGRDTSRVECGCSWIAALVEWFAKNPEALKSMKRPTIYTAANGGPYFKTGCKLCGHLERQHHIEYVPYCDDCPEGPNESYHEYEPA